MHHKTSRVLHRSMKVTAVFNSLNINLFHHEPVSNTVLSRGHFLSFSFPLLSVAIEKIQWWTHSWLTSHWEKGFGKTAGWILSTPSTFCSVLVVLVISLTVDLVEIAGCSLGPQWSWSLQSASHPLKAGSQWTLHQVLPTLHKPLTTGT